MNKNRIINTLLPKTLLNAADCDINYSEAAIDTFKRFINALPKDLINPHIYNPKNGIGISFDWHFNIAIFAISENKIYVEKLDLDHDCNVRDQYFDYKTEDPIPSVILDFLIENFSISKIGLSKYLKETRDDIRRRIKSRKEFEAHMSQFQNLSAEEKMGKIMGWPLRRELLYENITRKKLTVEELN